MKRYPTSLTETAKELGLKLKQVTTLLQEDGLIQRDPWTDAWKTTVAGRKSGRVVDRERSYHHPHRGAVLYTKLHVTAEGRRWLKAKLEQQKAA